MSAALTYDECRAFLAEQVPSAQADELNRTARALALMFRLVATAPAPKPPRAPTRRHKTKSVAESMGLKL